MASVQPLAGISLQASDVSGQKIVNVPSVLPDSTIGEMTRGLIVKLQLPQGVTYQVRLERQQRHLHASELASDALETGDKVVLQPSVDAGGKWQDPKGR